MGVELKCEHDTNLILNIYMPHCGSENYVDFITYLSKINHLINTAGTSYVEAVGDFNADISLVKNELILFTNVKE